MAEVSSKGNKIEREKEEEQNVYLDGIEQIVNTIQMQISATSTEVKKYENTSDTTQHTSTVNKPRLLTKPAKVPTWTGSDSGDILQTNTDLVGHLGRDS